MFCGDIRELQKQRLVGLHHFGRVGRSKRKVKGRGFTETHRSLSDNLLRLFDKSSADTLAYLVRHYIVDRAIKRPTTAGDPKPVGVFARMMYQASEK